MHARLVGAVLGILVSVGLSVLLWVVFDVPFLFLVVPFVPFLFLRGGRDDDGAATGRAGGGGIDGGPLRRCPSCGFRTREPSVRFCPHDGTELSAAGEGSDDAAP